MATAQQPTIEMCEMRMANQNNRPTKSMRSLDKSLKRISMMMVVTYPAKSARYNRYPILALVRRNAINRS